MKLSATAVCRALREDANPRSGWVTLQPLGGVWEPREVWLADHKVWVQATGHRASGWPGGVYRFAHFGPISAFRIRRAVKAWAARLHRLPEPAPSPEPPPLGSEVTCGEGEGS